METASLPHDDDGFLLPKFLIDWKKIPFDKESMFFDYFPTKKVRVCDAVLMSVGIHPAYARYISNWKIYKFATGPDEIRRVEGCFTRLGKIANHLHDRGIPIIETAEHEWFHKITFRDFSNWVAENTDWDLPPEFPGSKKSCNNNESVEFSQKCQKSQLDEVSRLISKAEIIEGGEKIDHMVEPKNKDDWFYAIRDCVREFEKETGRTPNETQLWIRLKTAPPNTYGISTNGKGELLIAGESPLDREAFKKRYGRLYPPNSDKHG